MNVLSQEVIAWAGVLLIGLALLRWHISTENHFDLTDLVCVDGKLNDKKFQRTGSWAVMTWGFYALVEDGKLTEWYVFIYGTLWVGNALVDKYIRKENENAKPGHN